MTDAVYNQFEMLSLLKMHPKCEGCGLEIEGGKDGCQLLIEEIWAREHADFRYGRFHRLVVDVYCLQHPWYCQSAKSYMAHLAGLCCSLEHDEDQEVYEAARKALDGPHRTLEKPAVPDFRGKITVASAYASSLTDYAEQVNKWGRDVWEAYAPLHSFVRSWLQKTVADFRQREKTGHRRSR